MHNKYVIGRVWFLNVYYYLSLSRPITFLGLYNIQGFNEVSVLLSWVDGKRTAILTLSTH